MEFKILAENENVMLQRKEIVFQVEHTQTGSTPSKFEVRNGLAKLLKTDENLIFIKKFETKTGTHVAVGVANVYHTMEQAKLIEPKYIISRNIKQEKKEEKGEE
ncbi:MAG: 30S ribosomal protein S24e [Candidatus Bathyarchaeia archaeon]